MNNVTHELTDNELRDEIFTVYIAVRKIHIYILLSYFLESVFLEENNLTGSRYSGPCEQLCEFNAGYASGRADKGKARSSTSRI